MQLWNIPELRKSFTSGSAEETSWKSWTCVPKLVCNFIAIFHMPNYLGSEGRSWLILQLKSLLWPDRPHRWVGSNTGQAKIIILSSSSILYNKFKKSKWSRDVSQTNLALTWSKSWIKPKTYRLCMPNLTLSDVKTSGLPVKITAYLVSIGWLSAWHFFMDGIF